MTAGADPGRTARKARRWIWAGLGVFVVAAAGIGWWAFGGHSRAAYDEVLARAKAAGFVLRVEDLPEWDVPAEEDCTAQVAAVLDDVRGRGLPWVLELTGPWDYNIEPPWYEHASPERMDALRAWLSENEHVFVDLDEALARRVLRVSDRGEMSRVGDLYRVGHILDASMVADHDPARRLRAACATVRLGDRILGGCVLEGAVGAATSGRGLHGLRRELTQAATPAARLMSALDACGLRDRLPTWRALHRAEIAFLAQTARPVDPETVAPWSRLETKRGFTYAMIAREIEFDLRAHNIAASDYRAVGEELRTQAALVWPAGDGAGGQRVRIHHTFARHDAALRLLRVALAATARRERDGRWPASLAELAPDFGGEVPVDPTTNSPFMYEVTGETMRVALPADSALRSDPDSRAEVPADDLLESGLVISVTR